MLLFGKPVAEKILSETKEKMIASGIIPGLAVVLVGDDDGSNIYVGIKEKRAKEIGMHFEVHRFEKTVSERSILERIRELNARGDIHGIIVQLPLPGGMNADRVIDEIDPKKDADGFLSPPPTKNVTTCSGRHKSLHFFAPVFPEAMIELAKSSGVSLSGKTGIVLANSDRFGAVMADALAREGVAAEYVLYNGTTDIKGFDKAEIVITALGRPELLPRALFKRGTIVIDGGIAKKDEKIVGDVSGEGDDEGLFLSPVPGGVGPVTVACLLRRVMELADPDVEI